MDPEHRFYFRGPEGALNLAAQNLRLFMQLADGVDDQTWLFHLRRGDYTSWFRNILQDEGLAALSEQLKDCPDVSATASRQAIFNLVRQNYMSQP